MNGIRPVAGLAPLLHYLMIMVEFGSALWKTIRTLKNIVRFILDQINALWFFFQSIISTFYLRRLSTHYDKKYTWHKTVAYCFYLKSLSPIHLVKIRLSNFLGNELLVKRYKTNPSFLLYPWNLQSIGPSDFNREWFFLKMRSLSETGENGKINDTCLYF